MRIFVVLIMMLICKDFYATAQNKDSLQNRKLILKSILPSILIIVGSFVNNSSLEYDLKTKITGAVGSDFDFAIDDYVQYVPIVELYVVDILKIKKTNHWFDQTKYLLISNMFTSAITYSLKRITLKTRPNGAEFSFPSGHTSFSFTNATVLYNELHKTSPLISYSGYFFAVTTGAFRMINNKHWVSDVLVGAGIGILVTNVIYYFEPLKNFNPFKKSKNISFLPQINRNIYGMYFSYNFRD